MILLILLKSAAQNQDISDELLTALANFKFSTLKEFELIKDNPYYVDVFIEINEKPGKFLKICRQCP